MKSLRITFVAFLLIAAFAAMLESLRNNQPWELGISAIAILGLVGIGSAIGSDTMPVARGTGRLPVFSSVPPGQPFSLLKPPPPGSGRTGRYMHRCFRHNGPGPGLSREVDPAWNCPRCLASGIARL